MKGFDYLYINKVDTLSLEVLNLCYFSNQNIPYIKRPPDPLQDRLWVSSLKKKKKKNWSNNKRANTVFTVNTLSLSLPLLPFFFFSSLQGPPPALQVISAHPAVSVSVIRPDSSRYHRSLRAASLCYLLSLPLLICIHVFYVKKKHC